MNEALKEAKKCLLIDEVPVGAIIVRDNKIIARAHNTREKNKDVTCHAEINALRKANKKDKSWRCVNATMYVTVEPCSMCAGALVWSRIDRIVFGAYYKKAGACGSVLNITNNERLNHQIEVTPGVLEDECAKIIKDYFKAKREKK